MDGAVKPVDDSTLGMRTAPDFDGLADVYKWMEWVSSGPLLSQCRRAFLDEVRTCESALVIGDGDGRFTSRLLAENQSLRVEAIDASGAMLRLLVQRAGIDAERLQTWCMDARGWEGNGTPYDLIVTHFFLDCLTTDEVRALAAHVRAECLPEAQWVVSEFAIPDGWFGHVVARPLVWLLYKAFGWMTGLEVTSLPNHGDALRSQGFRILKVHTRMAGLLRSELWRLEVDSPEAGNSLH